MRFREYLIERNIANISFVNDIITSLKKDTTNPQLKKWIETTVRKYLINRYPGVQKVEKWTDHQIKMWGRKPSWFDDKVNKEEIYVVRINSKFLQDIRLILLYLDHQKKLKNLNKISFEVALNKAKKYRFPIDDSVVFEDKDYKWINIKSKETLHKFGKDLQNCLINEYDIYKVFIMNGVQIFALVSKSNAAHVAIEVNQRNIITQIKGKQNKAPISKYKPYIIRFLNRTKFKIKDKLLLDEIGIKFEKGKFISK